MTQNSIMDIVPSEQYEALCRNSKVLQKDRHGPKLLALNDGAFVKIIRRKKLISSALWKPYAKRFQENSHRLDHLGISTVKVGKLSYCRSNKRHLVYYDPLPGTNLRELLSQPENPEKILVFEKFAQFLADIHAKGVFFRSIHFGNVIVSPDMEQLSLVDIADLKFYSSSLNIDKRLRNFKHFLRYEDDLEIVHRYGIPRFLEIYARESRLSHKEVQELQNLINAFLQDGGLPPTTAG